MAASVLAKVAQDTYSFPFRISKFHNCLVRTPQEYMSFRLLTMFLRKLLNQNYSGKSTNLTKKVIVSMRTNLQFFNLNIMLDFTEKSTIY